jgi:hypothetical protein
MTIPIPTTVHVPAHVRPGSLLERVRQRAGLTLSVAPNRCSTSCHPPIQLRRRFCLVGEVRSFSEPGRNMAKAAFGADLQTLRPGSTGQNSRKAGPSGAKPGGAAIAPMKIA